MWKYTVRRLLWLPFLLLIVSFITFFLGRFGPGDPIQVLMGQYHNEEVHKRLQKEMGLDKPIFIQYSHYIGNILKGDFGESFKYRGRNVSDLIGKRLWISIQLGFAASIISIVLGIPIGFFAATKHGTWLDTTTVSITLFFMSLPVFITAPFLLMLFVLWLNLLPSHGWDGFFSLSIIMPALVMGIPGIAGITRLTRASTLEILYKDYIRTARSKGLKEFDIQKKHILKNALIPLFTIIGLSLGTLVEGAFITEGFFGIPGIGRLAIESFFARDYPIITALSLLIASSFIISNLIVDLGYRFIDPRIKY